jgi:DNA-binding MarR family transcriptional regulator
MSEMTTRWDLDEIEVSRSAKDAALSVVDRLSRVKDDVEAQWRSAIRLAHANGASLRDIAAVAGVAPQTVSKVVKG